MKKGNADIIVLIVLVVILIGLVVFFGIKLTDVKGEESTQITGGASEVKAEENVVTQEKQIEYREKEVYGLIDVSKNLDSDTYLCKKGSGEFGSSFWIKLENGKVYISFVKDEDTTENVYLGNHEYYEYYEIPEIAGRVVDFGITYYWQNPVPIIVMLKEDGTISTADWNIDRNEFVGDRKIEGLENIVRIDEVMHTYKLQFEDDISKMQRRALVATNKDGKTELINAWKTSF